MSQLPADHKERCLALDIEASFCVQAPAGSGKTELLTQRYLSLLSRCERPEEILAITFTRKAASEMRNRILEKMTQARHLSKTEITAMADHERLTIKLAEKVISRDQALQWQLLENTTRLKILTIDSFNAQLTNQLPVVSALGVTPGVVDDASLMYEEAVMELLGELENNNTLSRHLQKLLAHVNNQWHILSGLLVNLLGKRDQWLTNIFYIQRHSDKARQILESTLQGLVSQKLSELAQALSPYQTQLLPLLDFAGNNLKNQGNDALSQCDLRNGLPPASDKALSQWQEIGNLLLTTAHTLRKTVDKRSGFPAPGDAADQEEKALRQEMKDSMLVLLKSMGDDTELSRLLEEFRHLPDPFYSDSQWQILESLTALLPALVSRLTVVFGNHGQTDYTQISIAALAALGNDEQPTDLALRLDYQLKHILVDEFQDTSSLQKQLLEKLTFGWQPGDGRTLFIVGDGMQSCYGFRNANVGLFLEARDHGIGQVKLQSLQLSTNFRSQTAVVDWVNTSFASAFPLHDDIARGAVRYSPAIAIHDELPGLGINTFLLTAEQELDDAKQLLQQQEASLLAEKIQTTCARYPSDTVAILVRTRSHLQSIIPVLRQRGIRWNAAEIDPLASYAVVKDLLMLTRALLNPADVTAWFALLRTPWFGLPLQDIHTLALAARESEKPLWQTLQEHEQINGLSAQARKILQRSVPILVTARRQRRRLPLRQWVENSWLALGGPAALDDSHYLDSVMVYFKLLQEHDENGDISDIHRFEEKVNRKFADGLDPTAPVTIMTIHKSKGLEFDHVFLPGLERKPRADDNPLLRWREHINPTGHEELVISMPPQRGQKQDASYQYLKYEATLQQRLETNRLFYIAVTRAIKSATLFASIKIDNDSFKAPDKNSLLAALWPQLEENPSALAELVPLDQASLVESTTTDKHTLSSRRLAPEWQPAIPVSHSDYPATRDSDHSEDSETILLPESVHDNLVEREMGDIIHHCLLMLADKTLDGANDGQLSSLANTWRQVLEPLTEDPDTAIAEITRQLRSCIANEKFQWLISDSHQQVASEISLSDYGSGFRKESIIDRTFVDENDVRWIIDYKTSQLPKAAKENAFRQEQAEKYAPQLARYAALYRAMENREIRTALFFTALPAFHEVTLPAFPESPKTAVNNPAQDTPF